MEEPTHRGRRRCPSGRDRRRSADGTGDVRATARQSDLGFLYRKFITALASDYRVIVPDHVGFGRSDKPFKLLVLGKGGWKRATRNNFFTEMFLIRGSRLDEATAAAYRAAHPTPDDRIGIARFPQLIPETANLAHESRRTMAAIESALPSIADRPVIFRKKTRRTRSCHGCERGRMRGFAPARCTRRVNAALLRPPRRLRLRSRR